MTEDEYEPLTAVQVATLIHNVLAVTALLLWMLFVAATPNQYDPPPERTIIFVP